MIKGYYTVQELSKQWNIGVRQIQTMCAKGKIQGAVKFGKNWAIPIDAKRPDDGRVTSGEYKNWRKKDSKDGT